MKTLGKYYSNNRHRQELSMDAKISEWKFEQNGILRNLKVPSHDNFLVEKPGRQHLSQVIKVSINHSATYRHHVLPDMMR